MSTVPATVGTALAQARDRLGTSPSPALDAELLLAHALGRDRTYLHAWPEAGLDEATQRHVERLIERRAVGEPVAYILGTREFWSLELEVTPDVLIPRPETEGLVEIALAELADRGRAEPTVLDVGTGSGCIALALARELPAARVAAIEASSTALAVARRNAQRLALGNIYWIEGQWLAPLAERRFDVIVSNPPYVRSDDPHLDAGDVRFEPRGALDGGADGVDAIRVLAREAGAHLAPGGLLVLEHGADQAEAVAAVLAEAGWSGIETRMDLAGLPRFALARSA
jgi:release factor glutamine methyltransferase